MEMTWAISGFSRISGPSMSARPPANGPTCDWAIARNDAPRHSSATKRSKQSGSAMRQSISETGWRNRRGLNFACTRSTRHSLNYHQQIFGTMRKLAHNKFDVLGAAFPIRDIRRDSDRSDDVSVFVKKRRFGGQQHSLSLRSGERLCELHRSAGFDDLAIVSYDLLGLP